MYERSHEPLHLIINDQGELLAFVTQANTDDRKPLMQMAKHLRGKLYEQGLVMARWRKDMKSRLVKQIDKLLLHKRAIIDVNDQLKNPSA